MNHTSISSQPVMFFVGGPLENYDYWANIARVGAHLPMPGEVKAPESQPGESLPRGEIEAHPGDFIFEGDRHHDRKPFRWLYLVTYFHDCAGLAVRYSKWASIKSELKSLAGGYDLALLKCVGGLASCVRFAHIQRLGGVEAIRALSMAAASKEVMSRIAQERIAPRAQLLGADGSM